MKVTNLCFRRMIKIKKKKRNLDDVTQLEQYHPMNDTNIGHTYSLVPNAHARIGYGWPDGERTQASPPNVPYRLS